MPHMSILPHHISHPNTHGLFYNITSISMPHYVYATIPHQLPYHTVYATTPLTIPHMSMLPCHISYPNIHGPYYNITSITIPHYIYATMQHQLPYCTLSILPHHTSYLNTLCILSQHTGYPTTLHLCYTQHLLPYLTLSMLCTTPVTIPHSVCAMHHTSYPTTLCLLPHHLPQLTLSMLLTTPVTLLRYVYAERVEFYDA